MDTLTLAGLGWSPWDQTDMARSTGSLMPLYGRAMKIGSSNSHRTPPPLQLLVVLVVVVIIAAGVDGDAI